jgi:hypothetical protein
VLKNPVLFLMSGLSFPFAVIALLLDILRIKLNNWLLNPIILAPWEDYKFMDPDLPKEQQVWSIGHPLVYIEIYIVLSILIYLIAYKLGLFEER